MNYLLIFVALLSVFIGYILINIKRINLPSHMLNNKALYITDFISEQQYHQLNTIMKEMKVFPSNVDADLKTGGFKPRHEHIGEAEDIDANTKTCNHPYLVPNVNRDQCILPQRIDIGRHFILTGGPDAIRESYDKMISRVSSFGKYMFNVIDKYPVVAELFAQDSFQSAAQSICPAHQQTLDPFQFNFIIQVPGQTVATHIDGAYFWGATRKEFPQWLLACMVFSNLWPELFIHQVQVVGYLHSYYPDLQDKSAMKEYGGDFVYYDVNSAEPKVMHPIPRSGALIDGTKTVHAAEVYQPGVDAPRLDKNKANVLSYVGNETWHLTVGDEVVRTYHTNDLRMSIVYRARCFASETEKDRFYNMEESEKMTLEEILSALKNDIVTKTGKYTRVQLDAMPILDLSFLLMDYYIAYPLPPASAATIPINYCALPKILPWTAPLISLIC